MALVSWKEIDDSRGAEISDDAVTTRRRTFYFIYDSHQTSDVQVIDDLADKYGIRRWTIYVGADGRTDPTCRAVSLVANQEKDFGKWHVTVTYTSGRASTGGSSATPRQGRERAETTRRGLELGEQPNADPRLRPPSVVWGSQEYEEAMEHDADGNPIQTIALERFVPAPTRSYSFRTLTIERNERLEQYSAVGTLAYENKVNSAEFYGFPALTVFCKSITATLDVEGEFAFWAVTYLFWIRNDSIVRPAGFGPWDLRLLHAGYMKMSFGIPAPIIDKKTGTAPSSPVPLDANGFILAPGAPPHYRHFKKFERISFTPLGL